MDLLQGMLEINPLKRISPKEVLRHPFVTQTSWNCGLYYINKLKCSAKFLSHKQTFSTSSVETFAPPLNQQLSKQSCTQASPLKYKKSKNRQVRTGKKCRSFKKWRMLNWKKTAKWYTNICFLKKANNAEVSKT